MNEETDEIADQMSFTVKITTVPPSLTYGRYPSLDSEIGGDSLECGNQVNLTIHPEAEGKLNCERLQYGVARVDLQEIGLHSLKSDKFLEEREHFKLPDRTVYQEEDSGLDHELILFASQSSDHSVTMLPEDDTKCLANLEGSVNYRTEIDHELSDLEEDIPEIEILPENKQQESFFSIFTDTLEYPTHHEDHFHPSTSSLMCPQETKWFHNFKIYRRKQEKKHHSEHYFLEDPKCHKRQEKQQSDIK